MCSKDQEGADLHWNRNVILLKFSISLCDHSLIFIIIPHQLWFMDWLKCQWCICNVKTLLTSFFKQPQVCESDNIQKNQSIKTINQNLKNLKLTLFWKVYSQISWRTAWCLWQMWAWTVVSKETGSCHLISMLVSFSNYYHRPTDIQCGLFSPPIMWCDSDGCQ